MSEYLKQLTDEARVRNIEKSKAARVLKKQFAEDNLKLDWQDENYWREICSSIGVKLPQRYDVGTRSIKKIARKLGVDLNEFLDGTGFRTLRQFEVANPTWPAFALAGIFIEWYIEEKMSNVNID